MTPFSFDFEQHALTEEQMKELIYWEALAFNPEYQNLWQWVDQRGFFDLYVYDFFLGVNMFHPKPGGSWTEIFILDRIQGNKTIEMVFVSASM